MNLFNDKDGKFKRLEKIILDIEKEKHTLNGYFTGRNYKQLSLEVSIISLGFTQTYKNSI